MKSAVLYTNRFLWATDLLHLNPTDNLLEIGCGAGLLAEHICKKLTTGVYTGIDRSAAMIEKAQKRNNSFVRKGIANFDVSDFLKATLHRSGYDKVVSFNVNFFLKKSEKEFNHIRNCLSPTGVLFIFYQFPFEISMAATEPVEQILLENSYELINREICKLRPTSAFCISAKPLK